MNKSKKITTLFLLFLYPLMAFGADPKNLTELLDKFVVLGQKIIPFFGSLVFLAFVYGVAKFIRSTGNDKEMEKTKNFLIWGVIGVFVMLTIYGIIYFIREEFGFADNSNVVLPVIKIKAK